MGLSRQWRTIHDSRPANGNELGQRQERLALAIATGGSRGTGWLDGRNLQERAPAGNFGRLALFVGNGEQYTASHE
jgi:hypothetical protein